MSTDVTLFTSKNTIVTRLFVDAADQDYVLSRLAYHKGIYSAFFWGVGQTIEKYLKASLLLNGKTSKGYGHDLTRLYNAVAIYAGDLLPDQLSRPEQFSNMPWNQEAPLHFLKRIEQYVSPDSRYNIFGYSAGYEDLFHYDQLVFFVRRLAFRLDAYPFIGQRREGVPQTVRELLESHPAYSPRGSSGYLDKLINTNLDPELRQAGLKLNFPFAPDEFDHGLGGVRLPIATAQSTIYTNIVAVAEKDQPTNSDETAAQLAEWALSDIKLPRDVKVELQTSLHTLRQRS